jgi:hypothetical protein
MSFMRVAALVALALATAACAGTHGAQPGSSLVSARTVSSSRLVLDGRVRCTATVADSVQAGSPLGLTFALRNVSKRPVQVSLLFGGLWLVVRSPDGSTYDTRALMRNAIIPAIGPTTLQPGKTKTVDEGKDLPVHWRGPLRVTPGCEQKALPVIRVGVKAPGPPPDANTAVSDVVAAADHLLDHCRPEQPGVPVQGVIYPPSGDAPPMQSTCSVSVRREGRFLVAQVLVASPPGPGYVHVGQPYERLSVHHASPYEASTWAFVVTKDGTIPVAAAEADATKPANHMASDWSLIGSHWRYAGDGRCGGSGVYGGEAANPLVEFISVCPS